MRTTSKTAVGMTILVILFSLIFPVNGFADWRDNSMVNIVSLNDYNERFKEV